MHSGSRAIGIKNPKEGPKKQPWRSISGRWPGSEQRLPGSAQLRVSLGRRAACFSRADQPTVQNRVRRPPPRTSPRSTLSTSGTHPLRPFPVGGSVVSRFHCKSHRGAPLANQPHPAPRPRGPGQCSLFPVARPLCNLRQFKDSHKRVRSTQYDKS